MRVKQHCWSRLPKVGRGHLTLQRSLATFSHLCIANNECALCKTDGTLKLRVLGVQKGKSLHFHSGKWRYLYWVLRKREQIAGFGTKKWGSKPLLDPPTWKSGGQLTALTPCFRGLWASLHARTQNLSYQIYGRLIADMIHMHLNTNDQKQIWKKQRWEEGTVMLANRSSECWDVLWVAADCHHEGYQWTAQMSWTCFLIEVNVLGTVLLGRWTVAGTIIVTDVIVTFWQWRK